MLRSKLLDVLNHEMRAEGQVSLKICLDIIHHYDMDIIRHLGHQETINAAKTISYMSFWIRKLKPISGAYRYRDIDSAPDKRTIEPNELHDVNERAAISIALELLQSLALNGHLPKSKHTDDEVARRVTNYFTRYLHESPDSSPGAKNNSEQLIYDMRYRTYGPHHLTNILNHAISHACEIEPEAV